MIIAALLVSFVVDKVAGIGFLKLFHRGDDVQALSLPLSESVVHETLDFLTGQGLDKCEIFRADMVLNDRWADSDLEITVSRLQVQRCLNLVGQFAIAFLSGYRP